jgi:5'(3')-deoxyribonucleotidase
MEERKIIVHSDLDGVAFDFDGGIGRPNAEWNPPEMFVPGFFRKLKPLPGAKEAITKLLAHPRIDLYFTTKPTYKALGCATEKLEAVNEHFPEMLHKTNIVCDKTIFLAGDFLIDDDKRWEGFKGTFIHFDKDHPQLSWKHAVELILDNT